MLNDKLVNSCERLLKKEFQLWSTVVNDDTVKSVNKKVEYYISLPGERVCPLGIVVEKTGTFNDFGGDKRDRTADLLNAISPI